jgi:DNA invertase Pin-like site-specific DNA recombinase
LDLGIDSSTHSGKRVIRILLSWQSTTAPAARRETILEKTRAGQLLAKAKHISRPSGVHQGNFRKVKKVSEGGVSVSEIVDLTDISISSVKRYRKKQRPWPNSI